MVVTLLGQRDILRVKLGELAIIIRILLRTSTRKYLQKQGEGAAFPFFSAE